MKNPEIKVCDHCGVMKYNKEFYKAPGSTTKLYKMCKTCVSERSVAYGKTEQGKAVRAAASAKYNKLPRVKEKRHQVYMAKKAARIAAENNQ